MKTAAELRRAAQGYFDECDATRERFTLKNGEVGYRQVPYTMAGLCARLGVPREEVEALRGQVYDKEAKAARERRAALLWAGARVEQYVVERALLGELNASVAALLLKGWGYGGEEGKKEPGPVRVVLEDPEGFGN